MMQEEISELLSESKSWKDSLVSYRETYVQSQKSLLGIASGELPKEKLSDLEHFQNQFYIQLLNIHDVKKDIKNHIHQLTSHTETHSSEELKSNHNKLKDSYDSLVKELENLSEEFKEFSSATA